MYTQTHVYINNILLPQRGISEGKFNMSSIYLHYNGRVDVSISIFRRIEWKNGRISSAPYNMFDPLLSHRAREGSTIILYGRTNLLIEQFWLYFFHFCFAHPPELPIPRNQSCTSILSYDGFILKFSLPLVHLIHGYGLYLELDILSDLRDTLLT